MSHWSLERDFQGRSPPWGWLNTIAFPSSKSQVCVAKHATRQWKLAVWMMVITLTTEAANASFQEGAVWWASLMSVQEQEFIYLLLVWLNCSAGEASDRVSVYLTMHYPYMYNQSNQFWTPEMPNQFWFRNANHLFNIRAGCSKTPEMRKRD